MISLQAETRAFINAPSEKKVRPEDDTTTYTFASIGLYGTELPANLNVFSNLTASTWWLEDAEVKKQVRHILSSLYMSLQKAHRRKSINNYLSKISLIQQADKAALLEWNFQDFRVGFTLEPNNIDSSYFVISQDKSAGSIVADTYKLDADISRLVDKIVDYVLENT